MTGQTNESAKREPIEDGSSPSGSRNGYAVRSDDQEPVTKEWLDAAGLLKSDLVEVRVQAISEFYDGIELWSIDCDEEGGQDGVLPIAHFPITRGDIRRLCWAIGIRV